MTVPYLDERIEGLAVSFLEVIFNICQVNLGSGDHESYEHGVIGPEALHGFVQARGEVADLTLTHFNCTFHT